MRMFGKEILVGTSIVNSLLEYMQDSSAYSEEVSNAPPDEENKDENNEGGAETKEEGQTNEGFQNDAPASVTGSKKLNADGEEIKTPSIAPSKAVSFAPGSKKGSPVHSHAGSKFASNKSNISLKSSKKSPANGYSPLAYTEMSINQRRRSLSHSSQTATFAKRVSSRRGSNASKQSSQIHYHIVSNPGVIEKTPLKKIFTPRKTPQRTVPKEEDLGKGNIDLNRNVTPFKQLISRPATPLKNTKESTPLLQDTDLSDEGIMQISSFKLSINY